MINSSLNLDTDFHEAVSVTALGNTKELHGAEKDEILGLYLTKHPYLEAFATSPTCAVVGVTIKICDGKRSGTVPPAFAIYS